MGDYYGEVYDINCLTPVSTSAMEISIHEALANLFTDSKPGALPPTVVGSDGLCSLRLDVLTLDEAGWSSLFKTRNLDVSKIQDFIQRVVEQLGADITDTNGLNSFALEWFAKGSSSSMADLVASLNEGQWWMQKDSNAVCIAHRDATTADMAAAMGAACGTEIFNITLGADTSCEESQASCSDLLQQADWVFGKYFARVRGNPLENCYFNGAAILASSSYRSGYDSACFGIAPDISFASGMQVFSVAAILWAVIIFWG